MAATMLGSAVTCSVMELSLRSSLIASLLGARMVMFVWAERASTMSGCDSRRPIAGSSVSLSRTHTTSLRFSSAVHTRESRQALGVGAQDLSKRREVLGDGQGEEKGEESLGLHVV